jgi:iron complex transport system substrate-binding protein
VTPTRRHAAALVALAFLAAALPAVAVIRVVDDEGATVTLAQPATRIVSLSPHLTEQLFAVGVGDRIVGTTEHADFPPAALQIPRVGRAHNVDLERVAMIIESIRRLGVPVFVSEPRSLDDVARSMQRLGALAGTDGDPAAATFTAKIATLRTRYARLTPVRVFYQVWAAPLMTLSGKHVISEAITTCGGRNVFADLGPIAPQVSVEAVLAADPQAIITAEPGARPSAALAMWQRFPTLAATRRGQVFTLDADRLNRHGPRLADEIEVLCAAIDQTRASALK